MTAEEQIVLALETVDKCLTKLIDMIGGTSIKSDEPIRYLVYLTVCRDLVFSVESDLKEIVNANKANE